MEPELLDATLRSKCLKRYRLDLSRPGQCAAPRSCRQQMLHIDDGRHCTTIQANGSNVPPINRETVDDALLIGFDTGKADFKGGALRDCVNMMAFWLRLPTSALAFFEGDHFERHTEDLRDFLCQFSV